MANDDLVSFRSDLKDDFGDTWDELADVISSMKKEFSDSDRQEFKDCTSGEASGYDSLSDCLTDKADEIGVGAQFRKKLNREEDLISSLRSGGRDAATSNNVSEAVRDTIDATAVSEIYTKCANYAFDAVEDELDMDEKDMQAALGFDDIGNYQDCVKAAAEVEDLSDSLKQAYDTA